MNVDVLIAGAGPAGLAAGIELRRLGVGRVLIADREAEAGGVPRHSAHTGYGLRDLRRVMTGPAYARHYARAAVEAGAEVRAGTTVTGWPGWAGPGEATGRTGSTDPDGATRRTGSTDPDGDTRPTGPTDPDGPTGRSSSTGPAGPVGPGAPGGPISVTLTSADGIETVTASAVLLATGCRERPRAARLVPGGRPPGVMTTGELQQRVYLHGQRLPGRALVIGAEHVSFSAMVTLAHAGADVLALVTDQPRHQSFAAFALAAAARWRTPVWTTTAVRRIAGRDRLEGVELADLRTGGTRFVGCDTVVFTGDWIPDHELARLAGTQLDPGTRGPAVDTTLETSIPGVFAAGNLVHAAETADVAAAGGRHAARYIAAALRGGPPPRGPRIPVTVAAPLRWISPSAIRAGGPPPARGHFLLRGDVFRRAARLEVRQGDRVLAAARTRLVPGRPAHLGAGWMARADPSAGPVLIVLR
ncbi:MAG TPA: FAD-dependent oxidoreductase [Streptosporangiaceae bacterium]|nr:FAD-dependent oxidoreductase [Streptosporangiaceae bacterium]